MITDSLPYLIQLIQKNVILHALIVAGNWHNIDLSNYDHYVIGQALIIKNFALSQSDTFEVHFAVEDDVFAPTKGKMISLSLITNESKYFSEADYYFNNDKNSALNKNAVIREERKFRKDLGVFRVFDDAVSPAFVSISYDPIHGSFISIRFHTNFDELYKIKRDRDRAFETNSGFSTVIGIARDTKAGAAIMAADKKNYFVEGLTNWDKQYLGKKIKVTGVLAIETSSAHKNDSSVGPEIMETQRIIKRPKWTLE